jgi:hypothetical protein
MMVVVYDTRNQPRVKNATHAEKGIREYFCAQRRACLKSKELQIRISPMCTLQKLPKAQHNPYKNLK